MKQKGIASIAIIGTVILFLITAGGFGYYLIDKNKKQESNNEEQNIDQDKNKDLEEENKVINKQEEPLTIEKIDGECGTAINDYTGPAPFEGTPTPQNNLCKTGTPTDVSVGKWASFTWWCKGVNGGDDQFCDTRGSVNNNLIMEVVDGACGPAAQFKFPQLLDKNPAIENYLCKSGKPSTISNGNSWKCYGINGGGKTASCFANLSSEEDVKKYFNASEIIYMGIPGSGYEDYIIFWSEAECPYSGKNYSYQAPDDYYVSSAYCSEKEVGTHGGCPTCVMSKIVLRKKTETVSGLEYSQWLEMAPALMSYCSQINDYMDNLDMKGNYINIDLDNDKEILVSCDAYYYLHNYAVLDSQNSKWVPLLRGSLGFSNQFSLTQNIEGKDYDKDGIDEITYSYEGWGMDGGIEVHRLYSFQDKKWYVCLKEFYINENHDFVTEGLKCGEYMDNENETNFKENKNNLWIYSENTKTWIKNIQQ